VLDVVVFGATGHTGRLVTQALERRRARFGLAGRDRARLEALADERGAADHGGRDARLTGEPGQHARDGALAAGARDGDAGPACTDHFGEESGPRHALDAEVTRGAHLGRIGLDGGRVDEAIDVARHGAAVLRLQVDAERAQADGEVSVLALVEGAVRALHGMAVSAKQACEGIHAGAGDAREVVTPHSSLILHGVVVTQRE
jgi:hypothetical protein